MLTSGERVPWKPLPSLEGWISTSYEKREQVHFFVQCVSKEAYSRPHSNSTLPTHTHTHTYIVCLLEVPDQPSPTLKLLPTHLAIELGRVGLHTAHIVILHAIHRGTLELTLLIGGG